MKNLFFIEARAKFEKAKSDEERFQIWNDLTKSFKTKYLNEVKINVE